MKRVLSLLLVVLLFTGNALAASYDLSGFSYDELVTLKDQINLAIWNSDEWQEVEVPQGVWVVGEDIPAGKWTIKAPDDTDNYTQVVWGELLDESGTAISSKSDLYVYAFIYNKDSFYYEYGDTLEVTWDLKEGQYVVIEEGIAVFSPYAGKPSLGFK